MTFNQLATLSNNNYRCLVQLDITALNSQWINAGAGIWYYSFTRNYPEVDEELLQGFTARSFGDVGSLVVDTVLYTRVASILALTSAESSFYFDSVNLEVWVHVENNDDPIMHTILVGAITGYSYDDFTPIDSNIAYTARLIGDIGITESRDPLFFGKLKYSVGSVTLVNSDGHFDTFADDNTLYGSELRILVGFTELSINDYITVVSSIVEKVEVSEDKFIISMQDKRKSLTKAVSFVTTSTNALVAIRDLLSDNYQATYDSSFYDTTAWAAAEALVNNVTIDIGTGTASGKSMNDIPVIDIIGLICSSVFGLFLITPLSKYSFKIIDTTASASFTIVGNDIINKHSISYDPSQVLSSVKVGYAKNWNEGYTSPYTFYIDTTQESYVHTKYKTYVQKEAFTVLTNLTDATEFAQTFMAYTKDVHGTGEVIVPIKYHAISLGDIGNIEINRETVEMLGTNKVEIISRKLSLKTGFITLGYRIIQASGGVGASIVLTAENGDWLTTESGDVILGG